jgi:hypothetical protein
MEHVHEHTVDGCGDGGCGHDHAHDDHSHAGHDHSHGGLAGDGVGGQSTSKTEAATESGPDSVNMEKANEECVGPASEQAGKASGCDGCPNQKACAAGAGREEDPDLELIRQRLRDVRHKVLVLSGKGGVGKSTMSAQLAFALAAEGLRVGLLDIDICGPSIPHMLGLKGETVHQSGSVRPTTREYTHIAPRCADPTRRTPHLRPTSCPHCCAPTRSDPALHRPGLISDTHALVIGRAGRQCM